MKKKGIGKFLAGAAIGGALGVLFAPKKGSESRQDLKNKAADAINGVKNADYEQIKKDIETKFQQLTQEVKDLDKEKVLKIAKDKAGDIKNQANELVNYAIEKGTPVIQKTADEAKDKLMDLLNLTIKKLESSKSDTPKKSTKTTSKK